MIKEEIQQGVLIIELPDMRVAAYRAVSAFPEIEANSYVRKVIRKAHLDFYNLRKFGVDVSISEEEQKKGLRGYEAWINIPDGITSLKGLVIKKIPAGLYATCKIFKPSKSNFDNISNGWIELHNWVKKSNYKSCFNNPCRYMLEEYRKENGCIFLQLYYPISN